MILAVVVVALAVAGPANVGTINPVPTQVGAVADTGKAKPRSPPRPLPQLERGKQPSLPSLEHRRPAPRPQPTGDPRLKRRKPPELNSIRIS